MSVRPGHARWTWTVPAVALCAVLAGCGDSEANGGPGSPEPDGDGLTSPGQSLDLGETATVPLREGKGVIELTVTGIEQGDPGVLRSLKGTPYYVRLRATAVSGDPYQFFVETYAGAWAGDTRVAPIASPLAVGPCERSYFRYGAVPGDDLDTCLTFVVPPGGDAIDRVAFENGEDYRIDGDTSVEWG